MAKQHPNELVHLRNYFYRDSFRKLVFVLLFSLILNVGLALIAAYLYVVKPAPQYFATSTDGKLIPMIPTSMPYVKDPQILTFAGQAAIATTTFDFLNYEKNLTSAQKYFTEAGSQAFLKALNSSGNLDTVRRERYVARGVITGVPVIVKKGQLGARYVWRVNIPLTINYENRNRKFDQAVIVDVLVSRVSTAETASGILIEQYALKRRNVEN